MFDSENALFDNEKPNLNVFRENETDLNQIRIGTGQHDGESQVESESRKAHHSNTEVSPSTILGALVKLYAIIFLARIISVEIMTESFLSNDTEGVPEKFFLIPKRWGRHVRLHNVIQYWED